MSDQIKQANTDKETTWRIGNVLHNPGWSFVDILGGPYTLELRCESPAKAYDCAALLVKALNSEQS